MTVRAGVIGVGHLGREHARVYAGLDGVELCGVVDRDAARARAVAERYSTRAETDPEALLEHVDAVSIVVPTPYHLEVARPFLERGKALLVEKPLAGHLEEADEMIRLAQASGAMIQVGHIERFNPVIAAAMPFIGDPLFIECDRIHPFSLRSTDVSVALDLMIHDIDLVLQLTDDELEDLDALGAAVLSPTEDLATARLVFRHGCTAMVKTSRVAMNRSRKVRIFGERSYISLDLVQRRGQRIYLTEDYDPLQHLGEGGRLAAPEGEAAFLARFLRTEPLEIRPFEPLAEELRSFVTAVASGAAPQVTAEQGWRAMAAAIRIEERMKFHRDRIRAALDEGGRRPRGSR